MGNIYYFSEQTEPGKDAGFKARVDVENIVSGRYTPLYPYKNRNNRLSQMLQLFREMRKVNKDDYILVQYPLVTFNKIAKHIMKSKKIILLIHDLNELRFGKAVTTEEKQVIDKAVAIISHNSKMTEYLKGHGISGEKIFNLDIFDYLAEMKPAADHTDDECCMCFAGNLEKSTFIYNLPKNTTALGFNAYGINYKEDKNADINYMGSFEPSELLDVLKGRFGLVWDGEKCDTCSGCLGNYMRYNNPHKLSMYIAAGIPVIVWSESAAADFVKSKNIGFSVGSLAEIPEIIEKMDKDKYLAYRDNTLKIREQIIQGESLKRILDAVEKYIA